jgi:ParB family chromosome partitioning protein
MGHARAIINIEDADEQQYLFNKMVEDSLSVRDVETLVRQAHERVEEKKASNPTKKKAETPSSFIEFQQTLSSKFDTKVKIKADERGRGSLVIPFKSQQDLKRLERQQYVQDQKLKEQIYHVRKATHSKSNELKKTLNM